MKIHPLAHASRATAHEAGHVTVAWYCRTVFEVRVDMTDPRRYRTGALGMHAKDSSGGKTPAAILATWEYLAYSLGGLAAESVILGDPLDITGSTSDIVEAIVTAKRLRAWKATKHCPWHTFDPSVGMDFADAFQVPLGMRERLILRNGYAYARYLVSRSRNEVATLRHLLLDRQRADWQDINSIFGPRPWAISRP